MQRGALKDFSKAMRPRAYPRTASKVSSGRKSQNYQAVIGRAVNLPAIRLKRTFINRTWVVMICAGRIGGVIRA